MITLPLGAAGRPLRVLCLGAHADDIEIGCGGTVLSLLAQRPAPVVRWVVFSGAGKRAAEAKKGAKAILGAAAAKAVTVHGFRDTRFPDQWGDLKDAFQALAKEGSWDVVFTHARGDAHQDHRVLSKLAWNAFRDSLVLEYEIPKWDGDLGRPNCYVPLTRAQLDRKVRALVSVYATQRSKDWFSKETFAGLARLRGVECRAPSGFAEAFTARKLVLGATA